MSRRKRSAASSELLANQNRTFEPKAAGATAEKGDKATIDFVGKIGDEAFEGGSGEGIDLVLGSNSFIPGFEDQVVGMSVGDERTITVSFPADYGAAELAGKEASFGTSLKAVAAPQGSRPRRRVRQELRSRQLRQAKGLDPRQHHARLRPGPRAPGGRRRCSTTLDKRYAFELPQGLVDQEFDAVWRQVEAEKTRSGTAPEDEGKSEDALKAEYRAIAERRVRLGLVLAEIGKDANVQVTQEELNQALMERVRQFPGEEKQVFDYFRSNPQAMAQIQAPLFEEKVVDHIVSKAKVTRAQGLQGRADQDRRGRGQGGIVADAEEPVGLRAA